MGKLAIAEELAAELGSTVDEAARFVDEVGASRARSVIDEAAEAGAKTVDDWWKPATAVGAVGGGSVLAWRQQDIERAKQIANQQQSYGSSVEAIMKSDLPPEKKQQLLDQLNNNSPASTKNKDDGGIDGGLLGGLDLGGFETKVLMLVVLLAVLNYSLGAK